MTARAQDLPLRPEARQHLAVRRVLADPVRLPDQQAPVDLAHLPGQRVLADPGRVGRMRRLQAL